VINLENLALADPNFSLSESSSTANYTMTYNSIFRTGIAFPVLIGTGKNI
jgi:hypothetical protein